MIIKYIPEDFILQEALVTEYSPESEGRGYMLFQMDKKGHSTFGAIHRMEEWFGISGIKAAGLKDSDGVTSQKISVPARYAEIPERMEDFNREMRTENSFIHLAFLGYAEEPLKIARLEGNAFRLRLRDMDSAMAHEWVQNRNYMLVFPNYFDKQRFGIPGHKKVIHLLAEALYQKDYRTAYEYLLESGAREAKLPFDGDYEAFFDRIDPRVRRFYDSALYAKDFNERLGNILEDSGETVTVEDEGFVFRMAKTKKTLASLMEEEFPEKRMGSFRVKSPEQAIPRKLITAANVSFLDCAEDEYFPGKSVVTVSFFLPMGAYFTMALKQLELFLAREPV